MQKWEYSFIVFKDNQFIFYETAHEPRSLFQINKSFTSMISDKLSPDFYQVMIKAINKIAAEGWELSFIVPAGLVWYFKRPIEG